jgi:HEAT repeat protein
LARCAAESSGEERDAARESLSLLRGTGVNAEIMSQISAASADIKLELVRSLGQRQASEATQTLFKTAADAEGRVRRESYRALAQVATPDDLAELTALLMDSDDAADRREIERTVVAVAQKREDLDGRATEVLAALAKAANDEVRVSLLNVIGRTGDPNGLSVLLSSLDSPNDPAKTAAIRALSEWPDVTPLDDLLRVAKKSKSQTQRILALRGYIGLLKKDTGRSEKAILKSYKTAMKLAEQPNEKRMVLSGLSVIPSLAALKIAVKSLSDSSLKTEAEVAVAAIASEMGEKELSKAKEILVKVLNSTENDSVKEKLQEIVEDVE